MDNLDFKKKLVDLVKKYLTISKDASIQSLAIDINGISYPRITLTLVKAEDEKVVEI